jgi:hypothetical protein
MIGAILVSRCFFFLPRSRRGEEAARERREKSESESGRDRRAGPIDRLSHCDRTFAEALGLDR